ncbi:MAG: hypothetical protein HOP17_11970 [Acidobacteria bacterium]|nr:hypothetical protein [Acidobacteriota bacterium]
MKYFLVGIFVVGCCLQVSGQAICSMSLSDLPAIHGIKLGASREDLNLTFASTSNNAGAAATPKPDLSNLEEIWTGFYHDRLASVEFDYDRTTEWKTVRQFAEHLERRLKLPMDSWVFVGDTEAMMECRDFKAAISSVRNTLSITDSLAKAAAQQEAHRQNEPSRKRIY